MKHLPLPLASVALAFAASLALVASADTPVPKTDAGFVYEVSRINQTEIAAARAILKTTTDQRVRLYADMMIADHSTSNVELRSAARKANINVPAFRTVALGGVTAVETPPASRTTTVGAPVANGDLAHSGAVSSSSAGKQDSPGVLTQASAAPQTGPQTFTAGDLAYLRDQVAGHERALAIMQAEAKSGQNPELKAYADDQVASVSHHLDVASADLNNGASPPPAGPTAVPSSNPTALGQPTQGPASQASTSP